MQNSVSIKVKECLGVFARIKIIIADVISDYSSMTSVEKEIKGKSCRSDK